jgi:two-component system OmpR family response regulator
MSETIQPHIVVVDDDPQIREVYDRSIDVQVLRLRRKIEAEPSQPQFILTERGVGYSLSAPVKIVY